MFGQIKYNHVPKNNATQAILSSFTHAYKDMGGMIEDYRFIDNIETGIRRYPDEIQGNVIKVSQEDLLDELTNLMDTVDLIIINGFDISLDDIKEKYMPLVYDSEIFLCINVFSSKIKDNNISMTFDEDILTTEKEDWDDIKEEIDEIIKKESTDSDKKEESSLKELLSLFGTFNKSHDELDDLDIVEVFNHKTSDSELSIYYNSDDTITIETNQDCVDISNKHFLFLLQSLQAIQDMRKK